MTFGKGGGGFQSSRTFDSLTAAQSHTNETEIKDLWPGFQRDQSDGCPCAGKWNVFNGSGAF